MSCKGKVYVGQVGVLLSVETQGEDCPPVDWTSATLMEIVCLRPDKTLVNFPAVLVGTKLQYTTLTSTDLTVARTYTIQSHVVGPGYDALGESDTFVVYPKWK